MSAVEYTKCNGMDCGNVTPDEPRDIPLYAVEWSRLVTSGETFDLCPECTRKVKEAVGLE